MKWTRTQLLSDENSRVTFDEDLKFDKQSFAKDDKIRDLKEVHVDGEGYYDTSSDRFVTDFHMSGIMVCPCSITNEDVDVPFDTDCHEVFAFEETDDVDVHVVKNGIIELIPIVYQLIELEVPLQVIKEDIKEYPHGDGWQIISEADYQKAKQDDIDPRLAKLKDFKFDD